MSINDFLTKDLIEFVRFFFQIFIEQFIKKEEKKNDCFQ